VIGFVLGSLFGFVAGYFRNSVVDRGLAAVGVWRQRAALLARHAAGHLQREICAVAATGGGPIGETGWQWDWAHLQFMLLPAITLSVIPTGIIARTVRSQVADILSRSLLSACAPVASTSRASSGTW
jgi:peptide/nickel transport system permease protein